MGFLSKIIDKTGAYFWNINSDGSADVQLTGSIMEQFGATIADRPAANSVPVGATFMIVGTTDAWQSNGTDWVVM